MDATNAMPRATGPILTIYFYYIKNVSATFLRGAHRTTNMLSNSIHQTERDV